MYNMKIEFSKKELNEIMEEMEQAQEKIFECWKRLESLGVAVVRESGHSDEQPELLHIFKFGDKDTHHFRCAFNSNLQFSCGARPVLIRRFRCSIALKIADSYTQRICVDFGHCNPIPFYDVLGPGGGL